MRRLGTLWLAAALVALTAVFATSAAAGGGQGQAGKSGDAQASQQSGGGHDQSSQKQPGGQQSSQTGTQAGTKPSSDTSKWTKTHVGDTPDVSKRYGNGTTAAQIAKQRGAPDSTVLSGPGNSQPHKVSACGKKDNRSGGVDVHAVKSYSSSDCQTQQPAGQQQIAQKPAEQKQVKSDQQQSHKITICHATGSATNPYVVITVDTHALKNGHTAAKGDIIPAPAGGCPTATIATGSVLGATATVCGTEQATSGDQSGRKDESKGKDESKSNDMSKDDDTAKANDEQGAEDNDADECTTSSTSSASSMSAPTSVAPTQVTVTPAVQQSAAAAVTITTATTTPTTTVAVSSAQAATQSAPTAAATPQGQVLGAIANLTPKKAAARGGVLGAVGNIAGATLPFTGFPVWLAVLAAIALLALGLVLRRGGGTTATRL